MKPPPSFSLTVEALMVELAGYQLIELSGEHASLPKADALGSAKALGSGLSQVVEGDRVLAFLPSVDPRELASRLALSRYVGEVLLSGSLERVRRGLRGIDLGGRSFRIRVTDYAREWDTVMLEAELGQALSGTGKVNLERPQREFRLVRLDGACLYRVDDRVDRRGFTSRKAENCPFFRPIGLHPKYARTLVNLTEVSRGETLLDPFCGPGGILLEGASVGARVLGSDLSDEMVQGASENLRHFNLAGELRHCDVGQIPLEFGHVDAIATDPPYGRSSGTMGEDVGRLLKRAFAAFCKVLQKGGRAAICLPSEEYLVLGGNRFRLHSCHRLRVHRSLVRYFSVFERV